MQHLGRYFNLLRTIPVTGNVCNGLSFF